MESPPGHSGALGRLHISYWPSLALMAWGLTDRHAIVTRRGPCSPSLHSFPALAGSQISLRDRGREGPGIEARAKVGKRKEIQSHGREGEQGGHDFVYQVTDRAQPRVTPSRFDSIAWPQVAAWVSWPDTSCPPARRGEPT